jgi:hypothetical protein
MKEKRVWAMSNLADMSSSIWRRKYIARRTEGGGKKGGWTV